MDKKHCVKLPVASLCVEIMASKVETCSCDTNSHLLWCECDNLGITNKYFPASRDLFFLVFQFWNIYIYTLKCWTQPSAIHYVVFFSALFTRWQVFPAQSDPKKKIWHLTYSTTEACLLRGAEGTWSWGMYMYSYKCNLFWNCLLHFDWTGCEYDHYYFLILLLEWRWSIIENHFLQNYYRHHCCHHRRHHHHRGHHRTSLILSSVFISVVAAMLSIFMFVVLLNRCI